MASFSKWIMRHATGVVVLGSVLAAVGAYFSVQLYQNLRPDMEELLPHTARSVVDLGEIVRRVESTENLVILIFSRNTKASRRFVDDLAARLKEDKSGLISRVEHHINRELEFFGRRKALYMDLADLVRIRDYIRDRIDYEREIRNPLNIFSGEQIPEPRIDFKEMQRKYDIRLAGFRHFPGGYYATQDETKRAVIVHMAGKLSGSEHMQRLKAFVEHAVESLQPRAYSNDLEVHYSGGIQNIIEEQAVLIGDLEASTAVVSVLVFFSMWLFFHSLRLTCTLLLSLMMGTFWTFGAAYFAVGYLNANSAFLASIVVGNGINFGIILLARYVEERKKGKSTSNSIPISVSHTAMATSTAALAAGLSYGSLMLTEFRGFNQFGLIGLIGMLLCWLSAFTVLPALLTLMRPYIPLRPAPTSKAEWSIVGLQSLFSLLCRHPRAVLAFTLLAVVASLVALGRLDASILEADMTQVRSRVSFERGSGYYSKYVDEIFKRYLAPVVILPQSESQADLIARRLREEKSNNPESLVSSVMTLKDFLPKAAEEKITVLREIQAILPQRFVKGLPPFDGKIISEFLTLENFRRVSIDDLPRSISDRFRERDGSLGKLILVEPSLSSRFREREPMIRFVRLVRSAADAVSPGAPVAGAIAISADVLESIERDGPRATFFAFSSVIVLVVVLFRRPREIAGVLLSLSLGVLWLAGIVVGARIKINFLNFIAFPITFGIGVDYGVNVFQRYQQEGAQGIRLVLVQTGGAVALCSLTTIIGYGSLILAQNRALVSFGWVAVLGELACICAALISLPAALVMKDRREKERCHAGSTKLDQAA